MAVQIPGQIPEEAQRRVHELLSQWHLPLEFMNEIIEHRAPVTFARHDSIFLQGSTGDVLYWILSGVAKVYCPLPDGTRVLIRVAGAGDFIGVIDTMGPSGRRVQAFEAEALSKVSIAILTRDHIVTLLKTLAPANLATFVEDVNTTWSELFLWCARFLGLSFRDRLQGVFEHLAGRFGVQDSRGILLTLELSHDELAEMIASSRPMVSRLIAEFIEHGELARQGKHYILVRHAQRELVRVRPMASRAARDANRSDVSAHFTPLVKQGPLRALQPRSR